MSNGSGAMVGYPSYLFVGRENTFGTYLTCTSQLAFTSAKFHMEKDMKVLEEITSKRTLGQKVGLGRKLDGEVSFYMASDNDACQALLQNAFGGGKTGGYITSATAAGDTVGAGVFEHVYSVGNFDETSSSLCLNHRKGDSTLGSVWEYRGMRVDSFSLKAKVDDALMGQAKLVGIDASLSANDLSGNVSNTTAQTPLDFVGMRFSVENTFASLTASSYWHVQSIDFDIKNSIKADASARRIGTDVPEVLMPGLMQPSLKVEMRFDDLTAYNAMLAQTQFAIQMEFTGATITGSKLVQSIKLDFPRCYIKSAGDPEIGGPDDILKSDVEFVILRDLATTTGYAMKATVRNKTASY